MPSIALKCTRTYLVGPVGALTRQAAGGGCSLRGVAEGRQGPVWSGGWGRGHGDGRANADWLVLRQPAHAVGVESVRREERLRPLVGRLETNIPQNHKSLFTNYNTM